MSILAVPSRLEGKRAMSVRRIPILEQIPEKPGEKSRLKASKSSRTLIKPKDTSV